GFERVEIILATGPKRSLIQGSSLPIALGAPLGDNMMTGTVGLLEAIRRHKGLEPIAYA
ncbi:MAG: pyruvate formate-lyase activating enzyme, partial [Deltaproteobacteria bacterium]|nr:pyruvate formate-lyase activating enzyme [Deltaproteobacteria bacterium]